MRPLHVFLQVLYDNGYLYNGLNALKYTRIRITTKKTTQLNAVEILGLWLNILCFMNLHHVVVIYEKTCMKVIASRYKTRASSKSKYKENRTKRWEEDMPDTASVWNHSSKIIFRGWCLVSFLFL